MGNMEQEQLIYENPFTESTDIVMTGSLLYRYASDQIELEGYWSMTSDKTSEKFSYLFLKKHEKLACRVKAENRKDDYIVNICSANLFEAILINNANIFKTAIQYLTGEYHGFFMYYDKTIEDRFYINLILNDNQVRITGIIILTP
jgi:hypothetical protein